ncbi:hypothetical protein [Pelomicrobium methylotrophicum]|uniref:hypothetical protein n=1 Tax=Pelomicrobium methylotrophicum TaxID=2602750 RepID=UPI00196A00FB|nr:hypothetical protein [Pelomicrobium methylotrophicum]
MISKRKTPAQARPKKMLRPVGKTKIPSLANVNEEQKEIFVEAIRRNKKIKI